MSERWRLSLFLVAAIGLTAFLVWGLRGTAPFGVYRGPYGDVLNAVVVPERHVTDMATAINFDYRGMDTLGEEFILFASVTGGTVLLRHMRRQGQQEQQQQANAQQTHPSERNAPESEAVQWLGSALAGLAVLFGIYVVIHAHQTPGGGFQGGTILGTACLLVYLTTEYRTFRQVAPTPMLDAAEALGGGGYALIGLCTLAAGGAFLQNVLPLGKTGALLSGGTIPLINLAVGLEVAAGFILVFTEFLQEAEGDKDEGDENKGDENKGDKDKEE